MKASIIQTAIGLTALVTSVLPQKAEACDVLCISDTGEEDFCVGNFLCFCWGDEAVCLNWP